MSTWLPIETAPRDGTVIDLWVAPEGGAPPGRVCDHLWSVEWGTWLKNAAPWYFPLGQRRGDNYATHWMPIPAPPFPAREGELVLTPVAELERAKQAAIDLLKGQGFSDLADDYASGKRSANETHLEAGRRISGSRK